MGEIDKTEEKKRVCLGCKKQLLDEKFPFCLRCRLEGRNTAGHVSEIALGIVVALGGAKAIADNSDNTKA